MLSSVTVIMRKPIHQFLLMLLLAFAVAGVFGQSTVQAAGEFEVPTINDHFNQVEKGPEPKKEKIVTQNPPKEEKGFFEKIGDGISDAVDWVSDTASDVWNLGVDVAATAWDWIVENKEYIGAAAVIIAGTVLCFVPGGQIIGPSILIGAGLAGGVAWFGGADSKEIAWDMFLGGLVGGASGGIGGMVANGIRTGGAGLLSRLGPVARKFLLEAIGTGAGGFTESVLWDKLKTGKINWKKAIITAGVGFGLILGAAKIGPTIINGINNLPIPSSLQTAFQTAGANTMGPQRFGDTPAGQWLQKFASGADTKTSSPAYPNGFSKNGAVKGLNRKLPQKKGKYTPPAHYQALVTGKNFEEEFFLPPRQAGEKPRKIMVDGIKNEILIDAKFVDKWDKSAYNPKSFLYISGIKSWADEERKILDQVRRYIELDSRLETKGVRFIFSSQDAVKFYENLYKTHFKNEVANGKLKVIYQKSDDMNKKEVIDLLNREVP